MAGGKTVGLGRPAAAMSPELSPLSVSVGSMVELA